MEKRTRTMTLFLILQVCVLAAVVVVAVILYRGHVVRVRYQESQMVTLRSIALQMEINTSLISDDTLRIRVAEYLSNHSQGRLTAAQCVQVAKAVIDAKQLRGVPPALALALMYRESDYNPDAVSTAGAIGICQVMPATARPYLREIGWQGTSIQEALHDPYINTRVGLWYLADLMQGFNAAAGQPNLSNTLMSYNYGEGAIRAWLAKERNDINFQYAKNILLTEKKIREAHFK